MIRRPTLVVFVANLMLVGCAPPEGTPAGDAGVDGGTRADARPGTPDAAEQDCGTTFRLNDATASSVWVSGDFLGWPASPAEGALEMVNDGTGNWSVDFDFEPARYVYKFVIDGQRWIADPNNP